MQLHESCLQCPATLMCRTAARHYTYTCYNCGHPWMMFLPPSELADSFTFVRFPKGFDRVCDHSFSWKLNTEAQCPGCTTPHRGRVGPWRLVRLDNECMFLDCAGDVPDLSKI